MTVVMIVCARNGTLCPYTFPTPKFSLILTLP